MIQFYFLSIVFNAIGGFCLLSEGKEEEAALETSLSIFTGNETFRLVLGVLSIVTGVLKILSSVPGDIPVLGDLFPALAGFLTGFILVFEYYRGRAGVESEGAEKLEGMLSKNRKWIGLVPMAAAVLHFLFPTVLFL
jgi:hypothetical protein